MRPIYERVFDSVMNSRLEGEPKALAELRKELAWTYSFAVPSDEALDELAAHGPLVEIGAGTGYWAWRLQSRGVTVHAYDRTPGIPNWISVAEGSAESLSAHSGANLFLCWPPLETSMASEALDAYQGDVVLYVGERGASARTGNAEFHARLSREFSVVREIVLPRWPGFSDSLWVFRRSHGRN